MQLTSTRRRRRGPLPYLLAALGLLVLVIIAAVVALLSSSASLKPDEHALAKVSMPLGGGKIESVAVTEVPTNQQIPVELRGDQIWPRHLVPAGQRLSVYVKIKRPGLISWLTGSTEELHLQLTAPRARLESQYLTLRAGAPVPLQFSQPVQKVSYGQPGAVRSHVLSAPETAVDMPRTSQAGSALVAGVPRTWEKAATAAISWFPAGTQRASAVASPSPGTKLTASTPISLTFSKPVAKVLGGHLPPVPAGASGTWQEVNDHTITFQPTGYGYGLGARVTVPLPSDIQVVGGNLSGSGAGASWSVPGGTTLRLQQLLSQLGYLPLNFNDSGKAVAMTPQAQEQAAMTPPSGTFSWRYPNTPSALKSVWKPGASGTMTQGAIMAFENTEGMTPDGVAGAAVWKALIGATIAHKINTFGYTFVSVSEGTPETESTWHNGKKVVSGLVNTGIPAAPTATGMYPVFEHALSVTMSGTNPDGSHYSDPGVPYVSYFNGGDALHGFIRASYGFPQSLGCVEMPYSEAASVYPYTPIGTLVNVT